MISSRHRLGHLKIPCVTKVPYHLMSTCISLHQERFRREFKTQCHRQRPQRPTFDSDTVLFSMPASTQRQRIADIVLGKLERHLTEEESQSVSNRRPTTTSSDVI
ncbi:hypothetical protein JTE90_001674 [Oedothorax gibbosus]|uniref:Uncharacterized protein n=1 Tax=Oedothorax gibbosus TaxID=931172 RepID=A0AAV6UJA9_9ARAC|nr:hypothetical protein JTE90_001674 [Oedothorax gibbosus]